MQDPKACPLPTDECFRQGPIGIRLSASSAQVRHGFRASVADAAMLPRQARVQRGPVGSALRLDWPGRSWEPRLRRPSRGSPGSPGAATVVEEAGDAASRLIRGDALDVVSALGRDGLDGRVDLVYIDPPFASQ